MLHRCRAPALRARAVFLSDNVLNGRLNFTTQVAAKAKSTDAELDLPGEVLKSIHDSFEKADPTKNGPQNTTPPAAAAQQIKKLRARFDEIGSTMNINPSNLSGWYKARFKNAPHLRRLVQRKAYLYPMLKLAYPEHEWLPWKFDPVPSGFWTDLANQRACLEWSLRRIRGDEAASNLDSWYTVTMHDLERVDSGSSISSFLGQYYQGSLFEALRTLYPDHQFLEWKMPTAPHHFWTSRDNRRRFFLWLTGRVLNLDPWVPESYYGIKTQDIIDHGGEAMLVTYFDNSPSAAIMDAFPEFRWQPWRFSNVNLEWWNDPRNHRRFMFEWALPRILSKRDPESLNPPPSQPQSQIQTDATSELTPTEMLKRAIEAELPAKFDLTLQSDLRKKLMNLIYELTPQELIDQGGRMILAKYKTIGAMAQFVFPDHKWDRRKFPPSQRPADVASDETQAEVLGQKVKFRDDLDASNASRSKRDRSAAELRAKLDEIGLEIGVKSLQDWYHAKSSASVRKLTNLYKSSLPDLLAAAYPDHVWHHWLFARQTFKFWQHKGHHRQFFDWVLAKISPEAARSGDLSAWYQVRRRQVIALGGKVLLQNHYSSNLPAALRAVYPEHRWEGSKFIKDVLKKSKSSNKSLSSKSNPAS